jgi:hypothetical protein
MTVYDLDRYVVREYERFARSFTNIRARDLNSKIAEAYPPEEERDRRIAFKPLRAALSG